MISTIVPISLPSAPRVNNANVNCLAPAPVNVVSVHEDTISDPMEGKTVDSMTTTVEEVKQSVKLPEVPAPRSMLPPVAATSRRHNVSGPGISVNKPFQRPNTTATPEVEVVPTTNTIVGTTANTAFNFSEYTMPNTMSLNHREFAISASTKTEVNPAVYHAHEVPMSPEASTNIKTTSTIGRVRHHEQNYYSAINESPPKAYGASESTCVTYSYVTNVSEDFVYDLTTANRFVMDETVDHNQSVSLDYSSTESSCSTSMVPESEKDSPDSVIEEGVGMQTQSALDCSYVSTCNNTTITMNEEQLMQQHDGGVPLLIVSNGRTKKVADNVPSSMKELLLVSNKIGEPTTIKLTFGNNKNHHSDLIINARATMMRFDPYHSDSESVTTDAFATLPSEAFQVSPQNLTIHRGKVGAMYVTFLPNTKCGVYGGVLKLRSNRKVRFGFSNVCFLPICYL